MVIFASRELKIKRLEYDLRCNNGENAKKADGQANGQLRTIGILDCDLSFVLCVWI